MGTLLGRGIPETLNFEYCWHVLLGTVLMDWQLRVISFDKSELGCVPFFSGGLSDCLASMGKLIPGC